MESLLWLQQSPVAAALTAYSTLYIVVSAAHILSIGLLVGAILPLDLRLLGLFRQTSLREIGPFLSRAALTGAVCALVTGALLFSVRASEYAENPAFLVKLGLVVLGLVNALVLHAGRRWCEALTNGTAPTAARVAAAVSLVTWPGAVLAGRWIGFL